MSPPLAELSDGVEALREARTATLNAFQATRETVSIAVHTLVWSRLMASRTASSSEDCLLQ